jgi:antitoxin VapB
MAETKRVRLVRHDGTQIVELPAEFEFDDDEIYVTRDHITGNVTLSLQPKRNVWKEFIEFRDSLNIPQEDLDNYMAERPMNMPINGRNVFEDEE